MEQKRTNFSTPSVARAWADTSAGDTRQRGARTTELQNAQPTSKYHVPLQSFLCTSD